MIVIIFRNTPSYIHGLVLVEAACLDGANSRLERHAKQYEICISLLTVRSGSSARMRTLNSA